MYELDTVKKELQKIHSRKRSRDWSVKNKDKVKLSRDIWNSKYRKEYMVEYRKKQSILKMDRIILLVKTIEELNELLGANYNKTITTKQSKLLKYLKKSL